MSDPKTFWRLCSSCKKQIPFGSVYYACSVSTCNQKRTFLSFCSVGCWQSHVPVLRHREAWAEKKLAPSLQQWQREQAEEIGEKTAVSSPGTPLQELNGKDLPADILIVASKLKRYIRARSGMNTSDGVMVALSDIVRRLCDQAIRNAAQDGRKTVMDRDFSADG